MVNAIPVFGTCFQVWLLKESYMGGSELMDTAYFTEAVALEAASDRSNNQNMVSIVKEACESLGDGRCIVNGKVYFLDMTSLTELHRSQALSKLSDDEKKALGLTSLEQVLASAATATQKEPKNAITVDDSDESSAISDYADAGVHEQTDVTAEKLNCRLGVLLSEFSRDNACHTPDFVMAEFLSLCLDAFERAVNRRDELTTWRAQ